MFSISLRRSAALFALVFGGLGAMRNLAQTPDESAAQRGTIVSGYGRLPLAFEINRGQADPRVRFLARGSGYGVFLTGQEAVLALRASPSSTPDNAGDRHVPSPTKTDVLQMQLLGGNPVAEPRGAEPLAGTVNYFRGNDPSRWLSGVSTFAKVKFDGVYPGVDLVYYGNQQQLEYDFVVAPGASPEAIRLHFSGARKLQLAADGDLEIRAKNGLIVFHKPVVYQQEDRRQRTVPGSFRLLAGNSVGFALGKYDHRRPLVIDPTLVYSTYLGGSTTDEALGIAVDGSGNAYITGTTSSADFPVTSGSYQTAQKSAGHTQAFVTKLNSTGTALIYSTYLGGSDDDDHANAIAVSATGKAYITGVTNSSDFPTTAGAFQAARLTLGGTAFVTEFDSTGSALVYSTYLGGSFGGESGNGIALDGSGDVYVDGVTTANDFPTTAGAFAATMPGFRAAFVTKLNPAGSALIYSTYLGGTAYDQANAIAIDAAGNAYVGGGASSHDFPVTSSAFQQTNLVPSGTTGFITKLNPTGSALVYSTYLGGSVREQVKAIAVDASGTAYAGGHTDSSDFPVTSGAFQDANKAGAGFVTHLNASGSALAYSTFLGPASSVFNDGVRSVRVNSAGEAFVSGDTLPGFPVTPGAFQSTAASLGSAFVTRLNATGTALVYSTCLGGTHGTSGDAIAIDAAGHAFVAGGAIGTDFPVSSGAFQTTNKSSSQFSPTGFVAAFDTNPPAVATTTTLTSSANPAIVGQKVIFDAAVDASSGNTTLTGNVVFSVDATHVATVALNAGAASYNTSTLAAGTHSVKATYQGDSQFTSSSDTITQTINLPKAAKPVFSPAGGAYTSAQSVTISTTTAGATIYYSIDGSTPTTSSTVYTSPVAVSATETIKAMATASGYTASSVASATYTIQTSAVATFSLTSIDFGNQTTGTASAARKVTLTNTGNATLSLTGFPITGSTAFSQTNACGSSLAAGASCEVAVVFAPQTQGALSATLSVNSNASGTAPTVSLTGSGTAPPAPVVTLTPGSLDFGNQTQGTSSGAKSITVKNTGNAPLTLTGFSISGSTAFSQTSTCGSSLAAGASCNVAVVFAPQTLGAFSATLSVSSNTSGTAPTVSLTGTGTAPPAPVVTLTPTSLDFGNQTQGTSSSAKSITVKNTGTAPLTGIDVTLSESQTSVAGRVRPQAAITSANYSATTTCGASLDAGANCTVTVTFSPTVTGSLPGTLLLTDNAANSPQTAGLSGTGTAVPQGDFTIAATPASASVTAGGSAQFHLTVGTSGGPYDKAVALSASGLPAGATASFDPPSVTPGSGTADSVLTIQTAATTTAHRGLKPLWPLGSPVLALLFFAIPRRLRRQWPRHVQLGLLVLASLAAAAAATGCGGGFALPRTSVTSTITVTATSGSDVHTTTVQLTVN